MGTVYLQKYREGKRIMTYNVETLAYANTPNEKMMKVGFTLGNMLELTAQYELVKLGEITTPLHYTMTNHPLKWFLKLLIRFSSDKVVIEFVEHVKKVAESEIN